jgi:hypothetical protein
MPFKFDFDVANRILLCELDGHVTDEVMKDFYKISAEHMAQIDPKAGIIDLSAVDSFKVSAKTARDLAHSAPTISDPERIRVIVAPSDHVFGMARLFQMTGERTRPNLHVVRTMAEAWAILGVQAPHFELLAVQ